MGTSNFAHKNRCVVVTNEDHELGMVPKLDKWMNTWGRSYPSRLIEEFTFWDVVLTGGYYEHSCIDYVEHADLSPADVVERYLNWYSGKEGFIKTVTEEFDITEEKILELTENFRDDISEDRWIELALDVVGQYLAEEEEVRVNRFIDKLKEEYGYDELYAVATLSNGETAYRKVGQ